MKIIVASNEHDGDIVFAESYRTAVEALIKDGWVDRYTEANGGYYGGSDLEDLFGDDWEERILNNYTLLEDLNIISFREEYLYFDGEKDRMAKAESMFNELGYEIMPPVARIQFQAQTEKRDVIIDVQIEKWRGRDGKYLKLTKEEIEACIQAIKEMGGEEV